MFTSSSVVKGIVRSVINILKNIFKLLITKGTTHVETKTLHSPWNGK